MKVNAAKKELFIECLSEGSRPLARRARSALTVPPSIAGGLRIRSLPRRGILRARTKVEMVETVLYRMAVEQDLGAICFFLKAHRPELYNKRMLIGLGGDPDNPLSVNHGIDDSEPWVIMMPENGRDRPDPDTATGPTIEGDADDDPAA